MEPENYSRRASATHSGRLRQRPRVGGGVLRPYLKLPGSLRDQDSFTCMFLACPGKATQVDETALVAYWDLLSQHQGLDP